MDTTANNYVNSEQWLEVYTVHIWTRHVLGVTLIADMISVDD